MSEKKKVISVMIPTYNEEENARPIYEAVRDEIRKDCPDYDYEILLLIIKARIVPAGSLRTSARRTPRSKPFLTARTLVSSTAPITA